MFSFEIDCFKIEFQQYIKYKDWIHLHGIIRNEWRKYFYQIIKLFGGTKAIYIPGFMYELAAVGWFEEIKAVADITREQIAFDELESVLFQVFGENNRKLNDIASDEYPVYIIDDFSDINLDDNIDIDDFKKYVKYIQYTG